jgi:hypothetical protein
MSVSIALNDGCDKPGEFSVAINSFKWDGPLPVTILPHTGPPIKLESELRSYGLASALLAQCQGCSHKFSFDSSPKVPGSKRFDINVRAVWGSMVTGNG